MSKIDTLKQQFPELNMSIIDIFKMMDPTKTNKYIQFFCKLYSKRFDSYMKEPNIQDELNMNLSIMGVRNENLSIPQMIVIREMLWNSFDNSTYGTLTSFIDFMERGLIEEKDVCKYSSVDEVERAVSLANLKYLEKEMEKQVHKAYEDETWLVVLPLTFESSSKYGSGTKWCTTYQKEKHYFIRYWDRGILAYFLNKKTGYKFAAFKALDDQELSFWNARDNRTDYLDIEIEDYMFPIVKNILKSKNTNSSYLDSEMKFKVRLECEERYEKISDPVPTLSIRVEAADAIMEAPQEMTYSDYPDEARDGGG